MFDLVGPPTDPLAALERDWSMWRYRSSLPHPADGELPFEQTTLGEGMTPLVEVSRETFVKLEQVSPTGSFKDRGASLIIALAAAAGESVVVADSSGNAGKAVAAYSARAGLRAQIFVPTGTPPAKTGVARAHGADVVEVDGGREAAADAARARVASGGGWYASHVYQAAFVHGVKTIAFELFEQLGGRMPGTVIVPAGNGSLVQGMWIGFRELADAGHGSVPTLRAVQSDRYAVLEGRAPSGESTSAAGIAIPKPPRGAEVRAAVLASSGRVQSVGEDEILAAQYALVGMGLNVEPTGAVGWAGLMASGAAPAPVVVVLTGR